MEAVDGHKSGTDCYAHDTEKVRMVQARKPTRGNIKYRNRCRDEDAG